MLKLSLLLEVLFVVLVGPVPEPEATLVPGSTLVTTSDGSALEREREVDPSLPRPPEVPGRADAVVLEGEGVSLVVVPAPCCCDINGELNMCWCCEGVVTEVGEPTVGGAFGS